MEESRVFRRLTMCSFHLYLCIVAAAAAASFFIHCADASREVPMAPLHSGNPEEKLNALMKIILDMVRPLDDSPSSSSNSQPYGVSSPVTLPPYDSLAPIPLPQNTPPFCVYPPFTSQPPPDSVTLPTPPVSFSPSFPFPNPTQSPPPQSIPTPIPPVITVPSPPEYVPSPSINVPNPPEYVPSPFINVPSPPMPVYSPPITTPRPPSSSIPPSPSGGFVPNPPVFLPPIVYPPPVVPPPPYTAPTSALWCVAKPSVPGPIIQEGLNFACASGADCDPIQSSGSCYEPNTLVAHASYAFNSYWQMTKAAGGTCGFGGIAILVTVDPSYDGCHFVYF